MSDIRAEIRAEVAALEGQLAAAKARLYAKGPGMDTKELESWSWRLWLYLLGWVLLSGAAVAIVVANWCRVPLANYWLAVSSGVLGASLSGLLSLDDRVANGWEFEDGTREPDPETKKERFNLRLSRGFLARPFLGVVTGPLVLAGGQVGQFAQTGARSHVFFFCLLGGLFSKTLLDWLKEGFKKILGK